MKLTLEQTDKIFNTITSNGCREMDEIRFNQAVNEVLSKYSVVEKIKVIINDTLKQIVVDAHLAGQTVIAGNGEMAYAEKYYNDSFPA